MRDRIWRPDKVQYQFLTCDADEVLFGGARGSGKTDALLVWMIARRAKYPGSTGLFLRRSLAELRREGGAIPRSVELLAGTGATWRHRDHKWEFPNGSRLEFGYLHTDNDVYRFQGSSYDDLCITQAEQLTEWQYRVLLGAVRTTRSDLVPKVRLDANPGGRGHAWLRARFVDPAAPGVVRIDPESGRTLCYIHAPGQSHHINPAYRQWLATLPEPWRTAWVEGRWDVFAGQFFASWDPGVHVCEPFDIPPQWPRWLGYDWGFASPAWWGWFVRAPWGTVYVYREWYVAQQDASGRWIGLRLTLDQQIARLRDMDSVIPQVCYTGGDLFAHGPGASEEGAAVAARYGIRMVRVNADRVQGWQRVHRALQVRVVDKDGRTVEEPEVVVFSTCRHLIRTLPLLASDESRPDDIADGQEDHAADGLRYALTGVAPAVSGPVVVGPPRPWTSRVMLEGRRAWPRP